MYAPTETMPIMEPPLFFPLPRPSPQRGEGSRTPPPSGKEGSGTLALSRRERVQNPASLRERGVWNPRPLTEREGPEPSPPSGGEGRVRGLNVAEEIALRIEEPHQRELLVGGRVEAAQRRRDLEVPAAGLPRGAHRLSLGRGAENPGQPQLGMLAVLLVHAEVRDHGADRASRGRDIGHLVDEAPGRLLEADHDLPRRGRDVVRATGAGDIGHARNDGRVDIAVLVDLSRRERAEALV